MDTKDNIGLVPVRRLPTIREQQLFYFEYFNKIQSRCFDTIFSSDQNAVIASPTGSGKNINRIFTTVLPLYLFQRNWFQINF